MGCVTTWWTCWQCTPVTTLTVDNNQIFIQSFEGFLKNHAKFCMAKITRVGHTSTSCQAGAKERFQQITEAYEALKACIRQSRVGCQLEPDEGIGLKFDRKQMASWLFLGNASQSVSRWWKASKGQRNLWSSQFQSTFSKVFLRTKFCHFLFVKLFLSNFPFSEKWWQIFMSPRRGSHPDLGLPRSRSGAARSHQSAIHAVLRRRNFRI